MTDAIPMPPKVAAAVAAVMAEVPKLQKGERNSHANYNFASIDDFLEAIRPLCAKHGLIIIPDEDSCDFREGQDKFGKPLTWLVMKFSFTLAHSSGETWAHRPTRTAMVQASMGSQAFGAAQSYALKQFERSLFQIATGEKDQDADSHPQAELPAEVDGWKERGKRLKDQIEKAGTVGDIDRIMQASTTTLAEIKEANEDAYFRLVKFSNERQASLIQATPKAA